MSHELPLKKETSPEGADRVSAFSAIAYGIISSQALFAALELCLFTTLSDEPGGQAVCSSWDVLISTAVSKEVYINRTGGHHA